MIRQITLEEFEDTRDRVDSPERREHLVTVRCGCAFEYCQGWSAEDPGEPWFPRPWQALPEFVGPLKRDPQEY